MLERRFVRLLTFKDEIAHAGLAELVEDSRCAIREEDKVRSASTVPSPQIELGPPRFQHVAPSGC